MFDPDACIAVWLSGELDAAGRADLARWLAADRVNRRRFALQAQRETLLAIEVRARAALQAAGFASHPRLPFMRRPWFRVAATFLIAALGLAAMIVTLPEPVPVASPVVMPWPDTRPIIGLQLGNVRRLPGNPRGWFDDRTIDVTTPDGRAAFSRRIMDAAEYALAQVPQAQGVIVWDIEGHDARAPFYVSDPRLLPELAPEMEPIADRLFARFAAAGLATGVRIGVYPWRRTATGGWEAAPDDAAAASEAAARARYAAERWGCRLFFLAHNLTRAGVAAYDRGVPIDETQHATPVAVIRAVQAAVPGCLVIPEYAVAETWALAPVFCPEPARIITARQRIPVAQAVAPGKVLPGDIPLISPRIP